MELFGSAELCLSCPEASVSQHSQAGSEDFAVRPNPVS